MGLWDGFRVQKLLREIKDPDPKTRIDAVDALGEAGDVRAVEPLIHAIQEKENAGILQARMIIALGRLQDKKATEILLRVVYGKMDVVPFSDMARLRAVESLGMIGDERAIRPLLTFLKRMREREGSLEGEIFSRVRDTLAQIGRKNSQPFQEAMKDPDDYFRSEAVGVLRKILDPESIPVLLEALNDVNYVVRINAAETLGLLRDPRAVEPLNRALRDVNRDVRNTARLALEQVEGRDVRRGYRTPSKR